MSSPASPYAALRGRRALVVDDNELNRVYIEGLLRSEADMDVSMAANGSEAVQRVSAEPFDIVLMDVRMPVMDGYEATALIRRDPRFAALPIIAVTANADAESCALCLAAGMSDHVTKPVQPELLFAAIAAQLGQGVATPSKAPAPRTAADSWPLAIAAGVQRCLGNRDLYLRLLERFVEERHDAASEVEAALRNGDTVLASRLAHRMISSAGHLGADALCHAARALETAIDARDDAHVPALLEAFSQLHAATLAQAREHLASRPSGA